jgi:hypothetical protein
MKAYGGVDIYSHIFLASGLVGGEWSHSRLLYSFYRRLEEQESRSGQYRNSNSDPSVVINIKICKRIFFLWFCMGVKHGLSW